MITNHLQLLLVWLNIIVTIMLCNSQFTTKQWLSSQDMSKLTSLYAYKDHMKEYTEPRQTLRTLI